MKAILRPVTGFYSLEKAKKIVDELNSYDDDDTYCLVDCQNGLGRIDVYDSEGELITKGFMV